LRQIKTVACHFGETSASEMLYQSKVRPMPISQAVILLDHHTAHIQSLADGRAQTVKAHQHTTRQHGSEVRSEHQFFSDVCDALQGYTEILVFSGHTAQADFRHYVDKHRAGLDKNLVGWDTVDHPSAAQALAAGRDFFIKFDRMAGRAHAS
jgi:hypothetical protein